MDDLIDFMYDHYSRLIQKDLLPTLFTNPQNFTLHIPFRH
jgi:hypothetical protein